MEDYELETRKTSENNNILWVFSNYQKPSAHIEAMFFQVRILQLMVFPLRWIHRLKVWVFRLRKWTSSCWEKKSLNI